MPELSIRMAFAAVVLLASAGCGKLDRVGECRALAKTVNPTFDVIEALTKKKTYEGYRDAAKEYEHLAKKLRKLPHSAAGAEQITTDYADFIADVVPALTTYANGVRDKDEAAQVKAARDLVHVTQRERALVTRVTAYCNGR
jgi:hypothetical protein